MCGILSFFARESVPDIHIFHELFLGAEERGKDGVGIVIIKRNKNFRIEYFVRFTESYSKISGEVLQYIKSTFKIGDILLGICRATPETEEQTKTTKNLQPIEKDGCILVHNGSVTDSIREQFKDKAITPIDSEAIIDMYIKHNRNMKAAMEELSGSFAFIMVDTKKDMLYAVTSFNPLAHMYVRGVGYFLHSSNDTLGKALYKINGQSSDGVNLWESWYHHDLDGYTIIETDLQSGFQNKTSYIPRFLHPTWDGKLGEKEKVIVIASGGIDSGLTAWILDKLGYDVELLHFQYGHRGEIAEWRAILQLFATINGDLRVLSLRPFYTDKFIQDQSMLTNPEQEITTGGLDIKSTVAWVAGRNMLFCSIAGQRAESYLLTGEYKKVYIASGMSQLSEETGGYPDNSQRFINAMKEVYKYGCITGSHIEFLPVLRNLTKTECWILGDALDFPFQHTCSCDNPKFEKGEIILCNECGSTKLSKWAAARAGVKDPRKFYGKEDTGFIPSDLEPIKMDVNKIIDRLVLPEDKKNQLKEMIKK